MPNKLFSPVFILGVPRSGTTLLRTLLDSHSKILGAPETAWLAGGYGDFSLRALADSLANNRIGAARNLEGINEKVIDEAVLVLANSILTRYLSSSGKEILVLKTPDDIRHLDFIKRIYPNARYIHIYRDGRDVACSTFRQKDRFFGKDVLKEYGELTILNALRRWTDWELKVRAFLSENECQYTRLSYEELVNSPKAELTTVCEFLGLAFEESMIDYQNSKHNFPEWEAGSHDVKTRADIDRNSIGIWKTEFAPSQLEEARSIAGPFLAMLGYESFEHSHFSETVFGAGEGIAEDSSVSAINDVNTHPLFSADDYRECIKNLTKENSDMSALLKLLELKYQEKDQAVAQLGIENAKKDQVVAQLSVENAKKDQAVAQLGIENGKKDQAVAQLSVENAKKDQAVVQLSVENAKKDQVVAQLGIEKTQLVTQLENLKIVRSRLEGEVNQLSKEIQLILQSRTFKVGKVIVDPARKIFHLFASEKSNK